MSGTLTCSRPHVTHTDEDHGRLGGGSVGEVSGVRRCAATRCPILVPHGTRYCPEHARAYERARGSRRERGYDATHDRTRARWQRRLDSGEIVHCPTCDVVIDPKAWDLGHSDDRTAYVGPQCRPCNRGHR